jgi:hypothetical protein
VSSSSSRSLFRAAATAVTALAVTLTLSLPAAAINTYNSAPAPERTEVGALVAQWDDDSDPSTPDRVDWVCSGTMIDSDVYLTAAHCTTDWPEGTRLGVSRAQDTQAEIEAGQAAGLSGDELFNAVAVEGTPHSDPAFPGPSSNTHDIAVLEFTRTQAAEVRSRWGVFTPATLPTAGQLSELGSQALNDLDYLTVGYGTSEAARGPGGHVHENGGVRLKAPTGFNSLTKSWLKLDMHAQHGNGGACYGDSGGPNFAIIDGERVLAGTTITGDVPCYATNVTYRMDSPSAQAFLGSVESLG